MDNLGDWLYIVLLVVAGISSMFGSGKKKKRPSTVLGQPDKDIFTDEQPAPEKGFWEILQEEIQEEPSQPEQPEKKVVPPNKPAHNPFLSTESTLPNQSTSPKTIRKRQPIVEESGVMPDTTFTDMAELRKAIICAEILNRKY